jgi:uncharacterized Rmd1/YagE family protein
VPLTVSAHLVDDAIGELNLPLFNLRLEIERLRSRLLNTPEMQWSTRWTMLQVLFDAEAMYRQHCRASNKLSNVLLYLIDEDVYRYIRNKRRMG